MHKPNLHELVMTRNEPSIEPANAPAFLAPRERVGLFIDGAHLLSVCAALQFRLDFTKFRTLIRSQARLVHAAFYIVANDADRPLIDWLDYNGFRVSARFASEARRSNGAAQCAMDIELAVDAMQLASGLDHVVLVAGKAEFRYLVGKLQDDGRRVTVISTIAPQPMLSDQLRRQADQFIDLLDLKSVVQFGDSP